MFNKSRYLNKAILRYFIASGYEAMNSLNLYNPNFPKINYIIEKEDWSISWDGRYISNNVNKISNELIGLSTFPANIFNSIVHFGSHFMWLNWEKSLSKSNKYVVTYFHGKPEDSGEAKKQIESFINSTKSAEYIVTAASLIEKRLLEWGIPQSKVIKIPLGVDTQVFKPVSSEKKAILKKELGIPEGCFVIGSFQKDGVGWGHGMEPKMIKGPDVFINTIKNISKDFNIFALLTGPARGYVKNELEKLNIPYAHKFINNYPELNNYYRVLDAYLVASREEGGPKAILESMACGVPIVSTNVGMAEDVILDGINGYIAPVGNVEKISKIMSELLGSEITRNRVRTNALSTIEKYDWNNIGEQYFNSVYKPLLDDM